MRFNKACELEDFGDPELGQIIRELNHHELSTLPADFPRGHEHRKDWEMAMAVRTLRHLGALRPDSVLLGVAVGSEHTIFYLTRHARQVFATDRYFAAGEWSPDAPISMLVEPEVQTPHGLDRNRLVVQHMDARQLRYPDATFDGIFSSGSIEHVGELLDVAHAAYEMGRVLKPGGILTLSTELKISGPPGGLGWPGQILFFSEEHLRRYIIEASGLELVDDMCLDISDATITTERDIATAIERREERRAEMQDPPPFEHQSWAYPHLVLVAAGYVFCSVHLALRRPDRYPVADNAWARPTESLDESVRAYNLSQVATMLRAPGAVGDQATAAPEAPAAAAELDPGGMAAPEARGETSSWSGRLAQVPQLSEAVARRGSAVLSSLAPLGEDGARLANLRRQLRASRAQIHDRLGDVGRLRAGIEEGPQPHPAAPSGARAPRWVHRRTRHGGGPEYTVVVDPDIDDPISRIYLDGQGHTLFPELVELMLEMTSPGESVLDLGAHLGTFTLAAAAAGRGVVAVEASPANAALLRDSVARNGFPWVHVIEAATNDVSGPVEFRAQGAQGHIALGTSEGTVTVPGVGVDALLGEIGPPPPTFVKMDVEGAEVRTLRGMRGLLAAPNAPALLYEVNCHTLALMGSSPSELLEELEELGYTSYLAEPPRRLIRMRSSQFYPQTEGDHLAVKRRPDRLASWNIEPTMTHDELVARVVVDCAHSNVHHRISIGRRLEAADDTILAEPAVAEALDGLRRDPSESVRAAVGWSSEGARAGDDGGGRKPRSPA